MIGKNKLVIKNGKLAEIIHYDYSTDFMLDSTSTGRITESMEFFESIKTFIVASRSEDAPFKEVAGTQLTDELFAYKEEGFTLHPEARWIISDIASGRALPSKDTKGALLRFATLRDCRAWVKDMPVEYKEKIEEVKASPEYVEACKAVLDFKNGLVVKDEFEFKEAFEALNELYTDINHKELF